MKKIVAISFLFLLLFNAFGYYLLFGYEQVQAHNEVVETVKEMPQSAFKVIKLLVSPYAHIEDRDFEYVEGTYQSEGKTFVFVKKRIVNDSLELYCLNNFRQDQLTAQFNDYVKENILNGKNSNVPTKQMLKTFLKDYIPNDIYVLVVCSPTELTECLKINIAPSSPLKSPYLSLHSPPPNVA